ncbi:hypothetical protein [Paractinoplanes globisporus]|uniref:Adhesin domain-containing protein n=1 Tax=Paractinoplanes globisporus TaxID=113565 RepID=A0ABW6WXZ6_9ACTN|nr:hypothetical protein [Actinoplanes globisporus]
MDASDNPDSPATPTAEWPRISDYWPDAPHRMSPKADYYPGEDPPAAAAPSAYGMKEAEPDRLISPPPPPARRGLRLILGALAMLVFLGGSVVVLGRLVLRDDATTTVNTAPPPPAISFEPPPSPPVSIVPAEPPATTPTSAKPSATTTSPAAVLPFTSGTFELASDVAVINVSVAALGADPVRVSTPAGSGLKTRLIRDGSTVRLTAQAVGTDGSGQVDVRLNSKVTWSLRMTGGAREEHFALSTALVRRIDLIGGVARIDMALPTPDETLPIRMTGGVNTWKITTPVRVPVRALLEDGGGHAVLNGDRTDGIDRDTRLRADGGDGVESGGLDIDAVAGLGTLIVAPAAGTG